MSYKVILLNSFSVIRKTKQTKLTGGVAVGADAILPLVLITLISHSN